VVKRTNKPARLPRSSVLGRAGTDLTHLALEGKLRPAFGVERQVAAIVNALSRADKASCALVGPAGVGKSAIVEQLAIEGAAGRLPEPVASQVIVRISLPEIAALQPPGQSQNDYWHYFRCLLDEARSIPATLFFDEFQGLFYWPLSCQTLKPHLARGDLRIIAATTPAEFDRFIRHDPALERRFQVIPVSEPSDAQLRAILSGVASFFEGRYQVSIGEDVLNQCIRLSRYLPQNQPDAAIDLLELAALDAARGAEGLTGRANHDG